MAKITNKGKSKRRFKSRLIPADIYNPEEGLDFRIERSKFLESAKIDLKKAREVRGWFGILKRSRKNREGYKVERKWIGSKDELRKAIESDEWQESKVMESLPQAMVRGKSFKELREAGYPGDQPGGHRVGANNAFYPFMGGPFNKQMYMADYLDMHAKCFEQKNHNPLAKQIIDVITNYTVGKGAKVNFNEEVCQKEWDDFAKRNDLREKNRRDNDTLTWAGEYMIWKKVINRRPVIEQIDPSTIWEIVTDPANIEIKYYYHQQYATQYQLLYGKHKNEKVSEYIINDIPAHEVIQIKLNDTPGEKRGRSDLLPIIGWLKRYTDYYDARVVKAQIEESFVLKTKLQGSDADVSAFADDPDNAELPAPGSRLVENEAVDTTYMVPTVSSSAARDNVGEAIRSICATGVGITPEMVGVTGAATQATAITKAEPTYKKIDMRQQINEDVLSELAWWVISVGKAAGRIPKRMPRSASLASIKRALSEKDWKGLVKEALALLGGKKIDEPTDCDFEVIHPEILTEDRTAKMKDIINTYVFGAFTHRRASEMQAQELNVTRYDYDAEMEERKEESENQVMDLFGQSGMPFQGMNNVPDENQPGSSGKKKDYKDGAKTKSGAT